MDPKFTLIFTNSSCWQHLNGHKNGFNIFIDLTFTQKKIGLIFMHADFFDYSKMQYNYHRSLNAYLTD